MKARSVIMYSAASLGLAGCSGIGSGSWQTKVEDDAMSGARVSTAIAKLAGETFDAEVTVTCSDEGKARYAILTFDKSGEPAALRPEQHEFWGTYFAYGLRQDDLPARSFKMTQPRYNNGIWFSSDRTAGSPVTSDLLTVRLFLASGVETYKIDQTDAGLRSVLAPCVDTPETIAAAEQEKLRLEQQERAQEESIRLQAEAETELDQPSEPNDADNMMTAPSTQETEEAPVRNAADAADENEDAGNTSSS